MRRLGPGVFSANGGGVDYVSLRWNHPALGSVGHGVICFFEGSKMWIADRSGVVVSSLRELKRYYAGMDPAVINQGVIAIKGARYIRLASGGGTLPLSCGHTCWLSRPISRN